MAWIGTRSPRSEAAHVFMELNIIQKNIYFERTQPKTDKWCNVSRSTFRGRVWPRTKHVCRRIWDLRGFKKKKKNFKLFLFIFAGVVAWVGWRGLWPVSKKMNMWNCDYEVLPFAKTVRVGRTETWERLRTLHLLLSRLDDVTFQRDSFLVTSDVLFTDNNLHKFNFSASRLFYCYLLKRPQVIETKAFPRICIDNSKNASKNSFCAISEF